MDTPNVTNLLLSVANGRNHEIKVTDFMRFYLNVWPFPDSNMDEENKYFNQVYTTVNRFLSESFDLLLRMGTNYR